MSGELTAAAAGLWLLAFVVSAFRRGEVAARGLLVLGGLVLLAGALTASPGGQPAAHIPFGIGGSTFALSGDGLWLLGFGLPGAVLAAALGPPARRQRLWTAGAAASLIGALGVFGLHDAASFLVAWELMSLGGALMVLGDGGDSAGRPTLFMLALLEVGAIALVGAFVLLSARSGGLSFDGFAAAARAMPRTEQLLVGFLFLVGFGAKLGLLPFYEWFPGAYGSASGATGALMSGAILNAAFFGLGRALIQWQPVDYAATVSPAGIFVLCVATTSAILAALYAFQQEDWRSLLSLSSAENGSIAVSLLGIALMFRQDRLPDLAGLAWTVALLHLAGHALAKGALFLCADGAFRAEGDYRLVQRGLLRRSPWPLGIGAAFAAMSLAAMPPQAGFVSEWFTFQTLFQGFRLESLASRLAAALAGAGLALVAAISLATFVKVFGLGLLGRPEGRTGGAPAGNAVAVGLLGLCVLGLAVGMPRWLEALRPAVTSAFGYDAPDRMRNGWLLVPLTSKFAFISPSKLIIAMPLLALMPILALAISGRRGVRQAPVWYGGRNEDRGGAPTTALAFSNALRTFYSFIYRPTEETTREQRVEAGERTYFVRRLVFAHDIAPLFGPYLFAPLERLVIAASRRLRVIQAGQLTVYLALIGALLVIILSIALA